MRHLSATIANGTNGASCSIADKGDGTATMTCPDGNAVSVLTHAPAAKDSGCNSAPGASGALVVVAALLRVVRFRRQKA